MDTQELGNYRILDALGTGGMGLVYRAEHKLLGQPAAIKVLRKKYSGKERVVQRFFNEAKAAAAVEHPGIVAVYDFGFAADGRAYLVMELLSGESLRQRLRRLGTLPLDQALRFGIQIANVLKAAHDHGIVHRDLKPDNVFLTPDPQVEGGERVKILDFGLAKIIQEESDPRLTHTKVLMGTPLYMSPEQCKNASKVDARADLYSLGCMLFEMLAGDPPLRGATAIDTIGAHIYQEPPLLSECWPHAIPALDALIAKLLAKDPAERYGHAAEVELALGSLDPDPASKAPAAAGASDVQADRSAPASTHEDTLPKAPASSAEGRQPAIARPGRKQKQRAHGVRMRMLAAVLGLGGLALGIAIAAVSMGHGSEPGDPAHSGAGAAPGPGPGMHGTARSAAAPREPVLPAANDRQPLAFYPTEDAAGSGGSLVTWQIHSEPTGAEVYYRGERKGIAPIWVRVPRDPDRTETLILRLYDHADAVLALSAASDAKRVVPLTPNVKIALYTKPLGAAIITADTGEQLGVTPGEIGLPPGQVPIAFILRLPGYRDERVEMIPDQAKKEMVALTKVVRHAIASEPAGAKVFRDGVPLGVTPYEEEVPASRMPLSYELTMDGYKSKHVRLRADQDVVTTVSLQRLQPQHTRER